MVLNWFGHEFTLLCMGTIGPAPERLKRWKVKRHVNCFQEQRMFCDETKTIENPRNVYWFFASASLPTMMDARRTRSGISNDKTGSYYFFGPRVMTTGWRIPFVFFRSLANSTGATVVEHRDQYWHIFERKSCTCTNCFFGIQHQ